MGMDRESQQRTWRELESRMWKQTPLEIRKGGGEGRENISSFHTGYLVTQENNEVIAMKLTNI